MTLKNKIILALMFLLFFLIIFSESKQKTINWYPSFSVRHKMPFGTYIAYREAKKLWKDSLIQVTHSPYVFLKNTSNVQGTYFIYNQNIQLGETNLNALLNWVRKGNNLMLSSHTFDSQLLDTLKFQLELYYPTEFKKKTLEYRHLYKQLKTDTAFFDKLSFGYYLKQKENELPSEFKVLGDYVDKKQDSLYNFVQFNFDKGKIFLHTIPFSITNYAILKEKENLKYFEGMLGYLQLKKPVYWDTQFQNGSRNDNVFKYLISNDAFVWSYRLFFTGLFLYILFEGKRKQRPIPVVTPPKNETLDFAKTIANLYLENKEHQQIAHLHIKYFKDYVRTVLRLNTSKWNNNLIKNIAIKSKTDEKIVEELFKHIDKIQNMGKISSEDVLKLDELINKII